jgi:hypothetical protein
MNEKCILKGLTLCLCCLLAGCSILGVSRQTRTITFRACILDVTQSPDGNTSVLLTVWYVGPDTGGLLPGANMRVELRPWEFKQLYGEALAHNHTEARGMTFTYAAERASDGSLSKLRLAPEGAGNSLIVPYNGPFADPKKVVLITY